MDKTLTKHILKDQHIPVVPWVTFSINDDIEQLFSDKASMQSRLNDTLGISSVWFVKPARAGSSVGVSKIITFEEFVPAIKLALQHDNTVIVERGIKGRELEVAVLGISPHHESSGVGEIIPGDTFYSYDDKYASNSASQIIVNADLPDDLKKKIRTFAYNAYELLGCPGLARVDFLLDEDATPYINEVNTLPGFTNISMYPKLWQVSGLSFTNLLDKLIENALTHHRCREQLITHYQ